jgi:hypothetical protein
MEVLEFADKIGAVHLKHALNDTELKGIFRRDNYFLLDGDTFLIIKVSRNKIKPFYGMGKKYFEIFKKLTETKGAFYFVGLASNSSGWILSKEQIENLISSRSLSISSDDREYKINSHNLRDQDGFRTVDGFLSKIEKSRR